MNNPFTGLRFARLELDNFRAGKMIKLAIVAISLIPLIYAGLFLLAFLDPYGSLNNVPAAVVNLDRGSVIDGEERTIGQELCDELVDNNKEATEGTATGFKWDFVDLDTAQKGLDDGSYYMEVIIPQNFSENIASADSKNPEQAMIQAYFNPSTNLIASTVGSSMVTKIKSEINSKIEEEYFNQIFVKISDASDDLQEAVDGSADLYDGLGKLQDGSQTLTNGLSNLTSGVAGANSGAAKLSSNVDKLDNGAQTLAEGASKLDSSAASLDSSSAALAKGAKTLNSGVKDLAASVKTLNKATVTAGNTLKSTSDAAAKGKEYCTNSTTLIAGALEEFKTYATDGNPQHIATATTYITDAKTQLNNAAPYATALDSSGELGLVIDASLTALNNVVAPYANADTHLVTALASSSGAQGTFTGIYATSSGTYKSLFVDKTNGYTYAEGIAAVYAAIDGKGDTTLVKGSGTLSDSLAKLAKVAPELTDAIAAIDKGASTLSNGTSQLSSGASTLADGTGKLVDGASTLESGSNTITIKLSDAVDGTDTLHEGLADGQQTMAESAENKEDKSEMMATPVQANGDQNTGESITSVKNYGTGFAPYFIGLGMWVGALMISFLIRSLNSRILMSRSSSWSAVFASYIPMSVVAILQVVILLLFVQFGLGLSVEFPIAYYGFGILLALCFTAIIQFFRASLGTVGMVVIVVLLMLQLCTAAGTFPIEAELEVFQVLNPLLPMTYVVNGFRIAMCGLSLNYMWIDFLVIAGFTAAFLFFTYLVAHSKRRVAMTTLYPPIQLAG